MQRPLTPASAQSESLLHMPGKPWPPKLQVPAGGACKHASSFGRWLSGGGPPLDDPLEDPLDDPLDDPLPEPPLDDPLPEPPLDDPLEEPLLDAPLEEPLLELPPSPPASLGTPD